MMKNIQVFIAIWLLFALTVSVISAQAGETCTIAAADLPTETQTDLRNRHERIENLTEMVATLRIDGVDEETVSDLSYWAVMADSAAYRSTHAEYPACDEYQLLDTTFKSVISDVYALSAQTYLIEGGLTNEFQRDEVFTLLTERVKSTLTEIDLWNQVYEEVNDL